MMKIVIPFKFDSTRLPNKNIIEFADGKSLLDISVENFKKHNHEVFLACEDRGETYDLLKKYDAQHIPLSDTSNQWLNVLIELSESLNKKFSPKEAVCFWQCIMPLFWLYNDIEVFFDFAKENIGKYESVIPVYEFKDYLVDENLQGLNFGPGSWHVPSQNLPKIYYITPMCVTTPSVLHKYRYTYSPNSVLWTAKGPYIDIDTQEEFNIAKLIWNDHQQR